MLLNICCDIKDRTNYLATTVESRFFYRTCHLYSLQYVFFNVTTTKKWEL